MWKVSTLCIVLVCGFVGTQAEKETHDESVKHKGKINFTEGSSLTSNPSPTHNTQEDPDAFMDSLLGYRIPLSTDDNELKKRGRHFGFVGSRGRRGKTSVNSFSEDLFPKRRPMSNSARLRMLLENRDQGLFAKEKRKPHFGFHGSRG
nr:TK2 [Haliotis discus hannai]